MNKVIILGGGFGGVAAANRLKALLPESDEVVLIDRRTHFMVGFRKTWALVGMEPMERGQRALADLTAKGVRVVQGSITKIDPEKLAVEVDGERMSGDALVVALGAQLAPEHMPGFAEHAYNVYEEAEIPQAAKALEAFQGGRVMVGIFGEPYKCPPAPYEIAIMVQEYFAKRNVDARVDVFTSKPMSLPILGDAGCEVIESRLAARGITFLPNHKPVGVDEGFVRFTTGRRAFDLLLGVPPHRSPDVVLESGLTEGENWISVNGRTFETRHAGVYAIGDNTQVLMANGKPLPKAGVFAEGAGQVVAERIAAVLAGQAPTATFSGEGGCFLEVGDGEAVMVQGNFLAEPKPTVTITQQSSALLDEKRAFETARLASWF